MDNAVNIDHCRVQLGQSGDRIINFNLKNFTVSPGAQMAVTGSSGSGKSTLLNVISGLQPIDQGDVYILEKAIHRMTASQADRFRGKHVGFVYQNFNLINGFTALENIMIGMRFGRTVRSSLYKQKAHALLDQVGLSERMHSRVEHLSVGERQRVAIARALANEPDLLLADEPTGSLDVATAQEILKLILDISKENKITLIFVTHDQDVAQRFPLLFHCQNLIEMKEEAL